MEWRLGRLELASVWTARHLVSGCDCLIPSSVFEITIRPFPKCFGKFGCRLGKKMDQFCQKVLNRQTIGIVTTNRHTDQSHEAF